MQSINITITINEEHIRDKAYQTAQAVFKQAKQHYSEAYAKARTIGTCHSTSTFLHGIHKLLKHEQKKYVRPNHNLFCSCRSCESSIRTYCKRIMSA